MITQTLSALEKYSKIQLVRFDIRCYSETPQNKTISLLRKNILKFANQKYKSTAWFFWVREQTEFSDKAHYHCYLLLNGHKAKAGGAWKLLEKAEYMQPDIDFWMPENPSYLLKRNDTEQLNLAIYRISYLAKNYSKQLTPKNVKTYQASKLSDTKK
ncbi:inovirus Gp2 family protein [Parashewanella spongiae]|nr:inovirus-type Gp2 protein [Parashewanella spongiae]MCL1078802.1 inovirus Gp2 family protein [Parashewanella spongiae]